MLTKVEVHSPHESISVPALTLSLGEGGANTEPIQIRDIQGLGPVKANVNTTALGSIDGEYYTGSSVGKRNIVMTLGLNPNWVDQSMSSLRQLLYAYFMPKLKVNLRFFSTTMATVEINGYIESFDPNIFTKDPEIQISIICPDPDFVDIVATVVEGVVNNVATIPEVFTEINYVGTVRTGFVLKVKTATARPAYTGPINVVCFNPPPQPYNTEGVVIAIGTVNTTQYFEMSSVSGKKYAKTVVISTGLETNLLRTVGVNAVWPWFEFGLNNLSITADSAGQAWTLTYFNRYGGL